jgi:serine/threonine-protein kinase
VALLGGLAWALAQNPSDGGTSGAEQRVKVPDLAGLSLEEARGRLGDAGLELGRQTGAASSTTASGDVISQDPAAGSEAERGSAVNVVVSNGPGAATTTQSPSATSTATPSASATSTPSTTSASADADAQNQAEKPQSQATAGAKEQQKAQKEAQKEAEKAAKKAAKESTPKPAAKPPPRGKGKKK